MWQAYIDDMIFTFRKQKDLAERAFRQVPNDDFFRKPGAHSNSIAIIIKHVAGNLTSRWTDFLSSDNDMTSRDRDAEFVISPADTRASLLAAWEAGWSALLQTLASLTESDWLRTVLIRGEPHTVLQAIQRSLAHTAYHVGQIVYLARMLTQGDWQWLTIAPGKSGQQRGDYLRI